MPRLVFFTSNRTKLAHLKYLAEKHGIEVVGFREKTFYATYKEPRIEDRERLLEQSYESALKQWERTGFSKDDIFFLEDTSVKVGALSGEKEVPGVDVKYWMRGMTFDRLNELLIGAGGDRSVEVRSDIVAHLPGDVRSLHGLDRPYLWVHGVTKGEVAKSEFVVRTNLIFPWLDDRTFNRWFVPEGFDRPISVLEISDADVVDFRARAFERLVARLFELGVLQQRPRVHQYQLSLPAIRRPFFYVICGLSCAGKSTLAAWFAEKYRFIHVEASDFMYMAFWQRHGVESKYKIGDFAEAALLAQPEIAAKPIGQFISSVNRPVIVTGFRSPREVELLQEALPDMDMRLIYLQANDEIRLARALARAREVVSMQSFHLRDAQERRMGVERIAGLIGVRALENEASLDDLFDAASSCLADCCDAQMPSAKLEYGGHEAGLEALILRALLKEHGHGSEFTTTEIAGLIKVHFGEKKSKNNVSRYFNQGFHPFFEASKTTPIRYSLSHTGLSVARILDEESRP